MEKINLSFEKLAAEFMQVYPTGQIYKAQHTKKICIAYHARSAVYTYGYANYLELAHRLKLFMDVGSDDTYKILRNTVIYYQGRLQYAIENPASCDLLRLKELETKLSLAIKKIDAFEKQYEFLI